MTGIGRTRTMMIAACNNGRVLFQEGLESGDIVINKKDGLYYDRQVDQNKHIEITNSRWRP